MGLTLDTSGFLGAMDAAARYIGTGDATDAALRGEIGKVLQRAVDYTKAPDESVFQERIQYRLRRTFNTYAAGSVGREARASDPRISNCTGKGNAWWVEGGKYYLMSAGPRRWWKDKYARYLAEEQDRQADLAMELAQYVPHALGARGLSKKSWLEIGDALGIDIPGVPSYVRAAVTSSDYPYPGTTSKVRPSPSGTGPRTASADSLVYRLENSMQTLTNPQRAEEGLNGEGILQRALASREAAIMKAIEVGIFSDLEKAVRRFPGLALLR